MTVVLLGLTLASATPRSTHNKNSRPSARAASAQLKTVATKAGHNSKSKRKRVKGQQVIQVDRARQIQTALVREGYLDGEPSGVWDQKTKDAMAHFQADHGWQTKTLPDSRALIQLGLGPNHQHTANAEALPASVQPIKNAALPPTRQ